MSDFDPKDFYLNCRLGIQIANPVANFVIIEHDYDYEDVLISKTINKRWLWMLLAGISMLLLAVALPLTMIHFIETVGPISVIASAYPIFGFLQLGWIFSTEEDFWNKKYKRVKIEKDERK